jgi:hypothetical protein
MSHDAGGFPSKNQPHITNVSVASGLQILETLV